MSIHAHLSEEALARLNAQRRNSTISSIVIAVLFIALVFLVLGIFLLPNILKETPTIVTYAASINEESEQPTTKVNTQIQRKPSAPSNSMTKVIAANSVSPTAIPVPEIDVSTPSADFGDAEDFGGGWGESVDSAGAAGFAGVPATMRTRCSQEDRLARLKSTGGTVEGEQAVVKALQWLKTTQNEDGSWDRTHPVAMTGFAILAYLGHCETPLSDEYGETVLKGITYLVNNGLKNDGRLTNKDLSSIQWVYDHGIATYALAESYTFCKSLNVNIPDLDKVTKQAGDIIMKGQADSGGWVYKFEKSSDGDNSVGFWQIQALKACKHTGLWSESKFKSVIRKALGWLEKVQGPNGAIGYRSNPTRSPGLTGGGVLAFQMWDEGRSKAAREGVKYISANSGFTWGSGDANLYYHYYNAQAMINHGGKEWEDYNNRFRDELIKGQKPDGSWDRGAGGNHGAINTHMATCLATLMLEVYYRFLPGSSK